MGLKNFEFLKSPDTAVMIRNTLGYNLLWIVLGLVIAVAFAIMMSELRNRFAAKAYQTMMFFRTSSAGWWQATSLWRSLTPPAA